MTQKAWKDFSILKRIDWWLLGPILFLLLVSTIVQYGIDVNQSVASHQFTKQVVFACIGLGLFFLFSFIDYRTLKTHPFISAGIGVFLLIAVLLFGVTIKGTTGWFLFGPFSLQPVEFVKLFLIIFLSSYFSQDILAVRKPKYLFTTATITAVIISLVIVQPDLGSSILLFTIWFVYMLLLRSPFWFIFLTLAMLVIASVGGWMFFFEDYQKDRLTTFLHPSEDVGGAGYNITQSITAVGSGSVWGRGLGLGTQSQLHFLPEARSDFIFAVIAEELGFVGVMLFLGVLGCILVRILQYMNASPDHFAFLILLGVFTYFSVQSFFVISMNMGLLPITGVPLPLVSAGGSSILATMMMFGIVHNIGQHLLGRSSSLQQAEPKR